MTSFFSPRVVKITGLAVALAAAGLTMVQTSAQTSAPASGPTTSMAIPVATRPSFGPITAVINGENLSRDDFQIAMLMVAGPRVFDEIVSMVVVQQAWKNAGKELTQAMIDDQQVKVLTAIKNQVKGQDGKELSDAEAGQVLAQQLQQSGVTNFEFSLSLRRQACLSAMAKGKGAEVVTDSLLDEQWKINQGKRYVGIDIVVDLSQAAKLRDLVETQHKTIEEALQSLGLRAGNFNLSEFDDKRVPKLVFDTVTKMSKDKLSAMIPLGDPPNVAQHMLYLKDITTPTPVAAGQVAAEKAKLRTAMENAAEEQWAQNHLRDLVTHANIDIKDDVLRQMYESIRRAQIASTQAAASQPAATAPAK